jgi:hypothetical protein
VLASIADASHASSNLVNAITVSFFLDLPIISHICTLMIARQPRY